MGNRQEIITALRSYKAQHAEQYGIESLGLFGSFARNEQKDSSDVDVCLSLASPDYFVRMTIQEELERMLNRQVDVISLKSRMRPLFKQNLMRDAIFV